MVRAVNAIAAALVGGFVGGLLTSAINVVAAWRQRRHDAEERQKQRVHDLEVHALEDARRLRDARVERLREDATELTRALFDLERLALLMQWGEAVNGEEMRRLDLSARARFESARAGLTLDPAGARMAATFESLTREIAQYQSMLQSHRVLVEARAVEQVVEHAAQMEKQHAKVTDGIAAALRETRELLESVEVPMGAPAAAQPVVTPAVP